MTISRNFKYLHKSELFYKRCDTNFQSFCGRKTYRRWLSTNKTWLDLIALKPTRSVSQGAFFFVINEIRAPSPLITRRTLCLRIVYFVEIEGIRNKVESVSEVKHLHITPEKHTALDIIIKILISLRSFFLYSVINSYNLYLVGPLNPWILIWRSHKWLTWP